MKNFFELITESIGWLQIVASPFLIGIIIGALIYFPNPSSITLILGIIVVILGLFLGIMWANKEWKGKGTIWFMSRVMATPELDNLDTQNKSEANKDAGEKNPKSLRQKQDNLQTFGREICKLI